MSEVPEGYTIVNRVAQSPHLTREIAKLSPVEDSVPTTTVQAAATPMGPGQTAEVFYDIPDHVGENVRFQGRVINLRTAEATRTEQVGRIEDADIPTTVPQLRAELFKDLCDTVSRERFEEFRDQVIRAFKHFGLDTRQFFG